MSKNEKIDTIGDDHPPHSGLTAQPIGLVPKLRAAVVEWALLQRPPLALNALAPLLADIDRIVAEHVPTGEPKLRAAVHALIDNMECADMATEDRVVALRRALAEADDVAPLVGRTPTRWALPASLTISVKLNPIGDGIELSNRDMVSLLGEISADVNHGANQGTAHSVGAHWRIDYAPRASDEPTKPDAGGHGMVAPVNTIERRTIGEEKSSDYANMLARSGDERGFHDRDG